MRVAHLPDTNKTLVRCPGADRKPAADLPPGFSPCGLQSVRSWFNFWLSPSASIMSPEPGESKGDLDAAMARVENEIKVKDAKRLTKKICQTIQL